MSLVIAAFIIVFSGATGGFFNAIIIDKGLPRGSREEIDGRIVWRLGFSSNVLCGAFAAFVSWGLYGPVNSADLFKPDAVELTLATVCGAALVGFSGASWLTTQTDKILWKRTAIEATQVQPSPEAAAQIATQGAQEALRTVRRLPVE
jgi:hypothetical protein